MPGPATKLGSLTGHGGTVMGPGCPTVLIEGVPAIRVGPDMHLCPMVTPATPPIPHVGMNNIGPGVPNVLIGGLPASTVGDMFVCAGPPAPVIMGATTVLIGTGGAGSSGSGSSASSASTAKMLKAGTVKPVKGTESFPIDIQASILDVHKSMSPQELNEIITDLAKAYKEAGGVPDEEEKPSITVADFVEILEKVERDEGFESARFFSSHIEFTKLCDLTRSFITGEDPNPDNDPNIMPTRFMILYGADDSKLQQIDDNPDCTNGENHKNTVASLRRALRETGYNLAESGPYDDELYLAHLQYLADEMDALSFENFEEAEEDSNSKTTNGKPSGETLNIKLEINPSDKRFENNTFCLFSNDLGKSYEQIKSIKDDAVQGNDTLELTFTGLNPDFTYTLEHRYEDAKRTEIIFRNRLFGEWN